MDKLCSRQGETVIMKCDNFLCHNHEKGYDIDNCADILKKSPIFTKNCPTRKRYNRIVKSDKFTEKFIEECKAYEEKP